MKNQFRFLFPVLRLFGEPLSLLAHPGGIGMFGRFGDKDFPCFQAQEHHHVEVTNAFGRDRSHGEEIAAPERFAVPLEEIGPRV